MTYARCLPSAAALTMLLVVIATASPMTKPAKQPPRAELIWLFWDDWQFTVKADGSGYYGFGGNPYHNSHFPERTFNVVELAARLEAGSVKKRDDADPVKIGIRRGGVEGMPSRFSGDTAMARRLFEQGMAAQSTDRVRELWRTKPPRDAPEADTIRAGEVPEKDKRPADKP